MSKKQKRTSTPPTPASASSAIVLSARNDAQKQVLKAIRDYQLTIISGPAGTGKTHLPVVYALQQLLKGQYRKIILTRPCVEAYGENLGFLPGDFNDKIAPYMIPIFEILKTALNHDIKRLQDLVEAEVIQTIPLAFQRGITFNDAIVIADEFQNTIPPQVRMFLTRIGENCKVIMTGDPEQNDISGRNGLIDVIERFKDVDEDPDQRFIKIVKFNHDDIVRSPIVAMIDKKYMEVLPGEREGNRRNSQ